LLENFLKISKMDSKSVVSKLKHEDESDSNYLTDHHSRRSKVVSVDSTVTPIKTTSTTTTTPRSGSTNKSGIDRIAASLIERITQTVRQQQLEIESKEELSDLTWLHTFNFNKSCGLPNDYSLLPPSPPLSPTQNRNESTRSNSKEKPHYSFSYLIYMAIDTSDSKRLSFKDIYDWIIEKLPYYKSVPSGSWKNSIRHNLCYNQCFEKIDKNVLSMRDFSGKGSLWTINSQYRLLINALSKGMPLDRIPLLQDVKEETIKMTTTTTTPPPPLQHQQSFSLNKSIKMSQSMVKKKIANSKKSSPLNSNKNYVGPPRIAPHFQKQYQQFTQKSNVQDSSGSGTVFNYFYFVFILILILSLLNRRD
jgi:hypothetical protein